MRSTFKLLFYISRNKGEIGRHDRRPLPDQHRRKRKSAVTTGVCANPGTGTAKV